MIKLPTVEGAMVSGYTPEQYKAYAEEIMRRITPLKDQLEQKIKESSGNIQDITLMQICEQSPLLNLLVHHYIDNIPQDELEKGLHVHLIKELVENNHCAISDLKDLTLRFKVCSQATLKDLAFWESPYDFKDKTLHRGRDWFATNLFGNVMLVVAANSTMMRTCKEYTFLVGEVLAAMSICLSGCASIINNTRINPAEMKTEFDCKALHCYYEVVKFFANDLKDEADHNQTVGLNPVYALFNAFTQIFHRQSSAPPSEVPLNDDVLIDSINAHNTTNILFRLLKIATGSENPRLPAVQKAVNEITDITLEELCDQSLKDKIKIFLSANHRNDSIFKQRLSSIVTTGATMAPATKLERDVIEIVKANNPTHPALKSCDLYFETLKQPPLSTMIDECKSGLATKDDNQQRLHIKASFNAYKQCAGLMANQQKQKL